MEKVKLCKDCRHYRKPSKSERFRCYRNVSTNPVTGKPDIFGHWKHSPAMVRGQGWIECRLDGTCGKEGRYWEPKG